MSNNTQTCIPMGYYKQSFMNICVRNAMNFIKVTYRNFEVESILYIR